MMEFLNHAENIRNICILAHVDHGKTTIADSLIASNGIISQKMAGKMRYLDNRPEEQERGITMKSSSIALKYVDKSNDKYLINLVDTPGHVDFCGEVSAAVRLCDGALIVIDVVEGVCPQTKVAIEQAWKEGIEPVLILNKIDRLILEQQLDETAAHLRLNQLLEQVNAIVATLLTTEVFGDEIVSENDKKLAASASVNQDEARNPNQLTNEESNVFVYDWTSAIEDMDDDKYYFMPEKNNVLFASSIDDWAFSVGSFSRILSEKHKINLSVLQRTLWGDFYIDSKQKRILKHAQAKAKRTLFTSMVLENIWKIYDVVVVRRDKIRMSKICESLGVQLSTRDLNHTDARFQVKLIMSKWLQLANNVLESVCNIVPSPKKLSEKRIERLLLSNSKKFDQLSDETKILKDSFMQCSSNDVVKVACISKMIPFERKSLPENRSNIIRRPQQSKAELLEKSTMISNIDEKAPDKIPSCQEIEGNENEVVFIAFARVFSGKLEKGDKLFVLGPRHDPSRVDPEALSSLDGSKYLEDLSPNEHITLATVEDFYLLMGRDLEKIDCAPAGNIIGIRGLEKHLIRTATLASTFYCPPFNDLHLPAAPILRVAIEPTNPLDTQDLINGLKLLNQADPCVEVKLQHTGEHVIVATGEVHLQHCIKDLKERYTNNIELNVSQPIVPFRETIVIPPKTDMVNETIDDNNTISTGSNKLLNKSGQVEIYTPNKRCRIKLKATPIPDEVLECLSNNNETLKIIGKLITSKHKSSSNSIGQLSESAQKKIDMFRHDLDKSLKTSRSEKPEWRNLYDEDSFDRLWSFGPRYSGPNLLIANPNLLVDYSLWDKIYDKDGTDNKSDEQSDFHNFVDSFISGFQLATQSGPLCEEPMMGVCFTITEWSNVSLNLTTNEAAPSDDDFDDVDSSSGGHCLNRDSYGPMSGQIISTVKECCRRAFQAQPQRLMSPMFSCDIQVTTDVLGKMYAVLGRRHGRILHGDMREGSQTFEIRAIIPIIESLDFVSEIRKQTSGMANPQLIFSHYEIIDVDPFWTPSTEEEYTLFGEKADTENRARKYMNLVRRRKGLVVQEKIVEHGEKQRTIKRNK